MAAFYPILLILHFIGIVIGAGAATFAEFTHAKAVADGKIDQAERKYLKIFGIGLRYGVLILLITNPLLILIEYTVPGVFPMVLTTAFWVEQTFILILIADLWLMGTSRISFWIGSAISFTSFWGIVFVNTAINLTASYADIMLIYLVVIFIFGGILEYVRVLTRR